MQNNKSEKESFSWLLEKNVFHDLEHVYNTICSSSQIITKMFNDRALQSPSSKTSIWTKAFPIMEVFWEVLWRTLSQNRNFIHKLKSLYISSYKREAVYVIVHRKFCPLKKTIRQVADYFSNFLLRVLVKKKYDRGQYIWHFFSWLCVFQSYEFKRKQLLLQYKIRFHSDSRCWQCDQSFLELDRMILRVE